MAAKKLTEYERKRLENIKRNDELLASLKIHSTLADLSSAKRQRGKFKCEPLFDCEREDNRERDTWRMTRRHVGFEVADEILQT
ncbi:hypothetical protein OSB04_021027 [Centaurea solstitialis]|uniref:Uncharacterized protein n=1 Tax=Centaurea solstitialis TaxID=347529 RepID=A0AA38SV20_9ASTR|nr:hypothetical protein OSB04_021027 [Centaurea solstitialis]